MLTQGKRDFRPCWSREGKVLKVAEFEFSAIHDTHWFREGRVLKVAEFEVSAIHDNADVLHPYVLIEILSTVRIVLSTLLYSGFGCNRHVVWKKGFCYFISGFGVLQ